MSDANILFKDGTKFYIPPPGDKEQPLSAEELDAKIREVGGSRGGVLSVGIPGFEYSEDLSANNITLPLPALPGPMGFLPKTMMRSPLEAQSLISGTTRDIGEELGSLGGGALAGAATKNPGAITTGSMVGAGTGRAAMGLVADKAEEAIGLPMPESNMRGDFTRGALTEGAGRGVMGVASKVAKSTALRLFGTKAIDAVKNAKFVEDLGIEPALEQIVESPFIRGLNKWFSENWFTSKQYRNQAQKQVTQLVDTIDSSLKKTTAAGKEIAAGNKAVAGTELERAWVDGPDRPLTGWRTTQDKMYAEARDELLTEKPVVKPNILHDELIALGDDIQDVLKSPTLSPEARRQLQSLHENRIQIPGREGYFLQDMGIEDMRKLRTEIGDASRKIPKTSSTDVGRKAQLDRMYKALTANLEEGYRINGGKDAVNAFRVADKYTATMLGVEERYLDGIAKKAGIGSAAKLYGAIESAVRGNEIDTIAALRARIGPNSTGWEVASNQYMFDRVLNHSDEVAPVAFLKMYGEMDDHMKRVVIGGPGSPRRVTFDNAKKYLEDNIPGINVAQGGEAAQGKFTNINVSGPLSALGGLPMVLGGSAIAGGGAAADHPYLGGLGAASFMVLGPKALFSLVNNKKFINLLIKDQKEPIVSIGAHLARVTLMATQMSDDDKSAVLQYVLAMDQLANTPQQQGQGIGQETAVQANPNTALLGGGM